MIFPDWASYLVDVLLWLMIIAVWKAYYSDKRKRMKEKESGEYGEIREEMSGLKLKLNTAIIDMHDYIDGTLTPLHKRLVTRARREKDKERSEEPRNEDPFDNIRELKKNLSGSDGLGFK